MDLIQINDMYVRIGIRSRTYSESSVSTDTHSDLSVFADGLHRSGKGISLIAFWFLRTQGK
ncbi:hypothetical protein YC2023_004935 [Brassica napus]